MNQMHQLLQHHTNPLHLYCRLRDAGLSRPRALEWSARLERVCLFVRKWFGTAM